MTPQTRVAIGGKASGPRSVIAHRVGGWAPPQSKYTPHIGKKQAAKVKRKA